MRSVTSRSFEEAEPSKNARPEANKENEMEVETHEQPKEIYALMALIV